MLSLLSIVCDFFWPVFERVILRSTLAAVFIQFGCDFLSVWRIVADFIAIL